METEDDDSEGLWLEHLPAWHAWCALCGQWRAVAVSTMAGASVIWLGLDYGAVPAALQLAGIEMTPELWEDVRAIEEGAIKEMNRRGR